MDQQRSSSLSRILVRFGSADARECYLPILEQSCALLELRTAHRMTLHIGDHPTASIDAVIEVDEALVADSSLPALALESKFSVDETSAALGGFLERIAATQSRRQGKRRMGLIKEAEAVLKPIQMRAFWQAVETWHWTEHEQEFMLMRGIGEVRRMQSDSIGGPLRDSLSSRFAWRSLWEAEWDRLAG